MKLWQAAAGLLLTLGGCAQNPVSGRNEFVTISEDQEIAMGRAAYEQALRQAGGAYDDPALQTYVQRVGEKLAAASHRSDLVYRFTVVDSPDVNAFALPGGYIFITRGLMAYLDTEAELAAVLGHEIGHVTARHAVRQLSAAQAAQLGFAITSIFVPELRGGAGQDLFNVLGTAWLRGYGRDMELEADGLGAEYLARSGYDAHAVTEVLSVLKAQEEFEAAIAKKEGREPRAYHGVFATHPNNDKRLREIVDDAERLAQAKGETPGAPLEDYLAELDGLVFGTGEREGVLRGGAFYHRELGIAMTFPQAWRVENRPDRLVAFPPAADAQFQVVTEDLNKRISPREFMVSRLKLKDLRQGEELSIAGLPGYTAMAEGRTPYGTRSVRYAVVFHNNRAYVFAGAAREVYRSHAYDGDFRDWVRSFHPLRDEEKSLARALRVKVIEASAAADIKALAARSPLHEHAEERLRLLNQLYPHGEVKPGQRLKVIE